ncbi:MAG: sulfotransferase [Rhodanobacter sp.]
MKLQVPFVQLPLQFDAARLLSEVEALDPGHWREHPQKFPGNFALPLIAVGGDPQSDAIAGPMRPTPLLAQCPYLMQVLGRLGAVWGRTRLMKLSGHAEVTPHADINYYWRERVRVHVPIATRPTVRFICGEAEVNMAAGESWIFDTWRTHQVVNAAEDERIHLVADTIGSDHFADLVRRGRAPGHGEFSGWQTEWVAPRAADGPALRYESVNVPVVMTPWELREHIGFLFGHVRPHPQLAVAHQTAARFLGIWHALWAEHGVDRAGWPAYRDALDVFETHMERLAVSLQLVNGAMFMNTLRGMILRVALADHEPAVDAYEPRPPAPASAMEIKPGDGAKCDPVFDRPIFIISPPRAGSTLLFETLADSPDLCTIGHESHALIEGLADLHPGYRQFDSNRLDETMVTPSLAEELRRRFHAELRDRHGHPVLGQPVRLLEKTPKNALRVLFLAKIFPSAHFIYLHRDPRQTLSSMLEAWHSGRFRTYPQLPGWSGPPWSLLLIPGWRELIGRSLPEIVATQWETTTRILLDDLAAIPADRCHVVRYDALLANPGAEVSRLAQALGFGWDQPVNADLPLSRYTVSPPAADKWKRHAELLEPLLVEMQVTAERARIFAGA